MLSVSVPSRVPRPPTRHTACVTVMVEPVYTVGARRDHPPAALTGPGRWFSRSRPPKPEDLLAKQGFLRSALAGATGLWQKRARDRDFPDLDSPDPEQQGQALFRRGRH